MIKIEQLSAGSIWVLVNFGGLSLLGGGGLELVIRTGGDGVCVKELKNFQISDSRDWQLAHRSNEACRQTSPISLAPRLHERKGTLSA